eukprot:CFRG8291T1
MVRHYIDYKMTLYLTKASDAVLAESKHLFTPAEMESEMEYLCGEFDTIEDFTETFRQLSAKEKFYPHVTATESLSDSSTSDCETWMASVASA